MIVVEMVGATNGAGDTETILLSDEAFTTSPTDTPPDQNAKPRLTDPGAISFSIYLDSNQVLGGGTKLSIGEIVATNIDGEFDRLKGLSFDGRPIVMRVGDKGGAYPDDFTVVLRATMAGVTVAWSQLIVDVRDATYVFDKPILTARFAGTNQLPDGIEGTPDDVGGQLIPMVIGSVREISPPCCNTAKLAYRVLGPVSAFPAVYIRGASQTLTTDYDTSADLMAATLAGGTYATCVNEGLFRVGAQDGTVTCDVINDLGASAAADLLAKLAKLAGLTDAEIDQNDRIALAAKNAATLGRYIDDESTFTTVMDEIAQTVGGWYGRDPLGQFRMGRLDLPLGLPLATLTKSQIAADGIERTTLQGMPTPIWSVTVNHTKVWDVQTSDLIGNIDAARRAFLGQEYRSATSTKPEVQTQFLLAGTLTIDSLFQDAAAGAAEATRKRDLHDAPHDVFEVPLPMKEAQKLFAAGVWLGSELALDLDRFDLAGGRSFIVLGIAFQRRAKQVVFSLWASADKPAVFFVAAEGNATGFADARAVGQDAHGPVPAVGSATATSSAQGVGDVVDSTDTTGQPAGLLLAILQGAKKGPSGAGVAAGVGSAQGAGQARVEGQGQSFGQGDAKGVGAAITTGGGTAGQPVGLLLGITKAS